MKANRISLVTLAARDVAALRGFYEALGWEASEAAPGIVFFDLGGMKLAIYDRTALANDLGRAPDALGTGAMTLAQNFPDPAAVDAAYAAALAAGARPLGPPEEVFWGGYSGTWADPEGHVWEYAHNPFWSLDDEGRLVS